tara:strand:+ start:1587 stop:1763 length:177 start_codon:yes stop_codon:yes gene_type:complete
MEFKTEQEFVGWYLTKHMKNHNLPYSMAYYNLLELTTYKAEKAYKRYLKRYATSKVKG